VALKPENILIKNPRIRNLIVITALIITFFASWLPDFEIVLGMESGRISSMLAFGTFNGFLLGPIIGPLVTITAMLLHLPIDPDYLGDNVFTLLSTGFIALAAMIAGLCITGKQKIATVIFGILILLWFITPTGLEAYSYIWFHVVVFACFIIVSKESIFKRISRQWQIFLYLFLVSLLAVLADHLAGSITAAIVFNLDADLFRKVVFLYPVERLILAFSASVFGYIFYQWAQIINTECYGTTEEPFLDIQEMIDYIETDVKTILQNEKK